MEQQYLEMAAADQSPDDKLHPYYYHIYSQSLPTEAAYRVMRAEIHQKSTTLIESKSSAFRKNRRYIFEGYNNWTELEKEWIAKVKLEMR